MHARVIRISAYENKLPELIALLQETVLPAARQQHGFQGVMVMGDERTNTATVISFWRRADEEQTSAHARFLETTMREVSTTLGYRQEIETFAVFFAEWPREAVSAPGDASSAP